MLPHKPGIVCGRCHVMHRGLQTDYMRFVAPQEKGGHAGPGCETTYSHTKGQVLTGSIVYIGQLSYSA